MPVLTEDRERGVEPPTAEGDAVVLPVGLEEGPDGATLVHALSLPGCVSVGRTQQEALDAFAVELGEWLSTLAELGEPVPSPERELEIAVEEWIASDADVSAGESTVCFEADLAPLGDAEVRLGLRRLGDLRGLLLRRVRRLSDAELDRRVGGWTARQALDELARAQWWTLTRLGASPMADIPPRTLGRLDTAMALVVQQFTNLPGDLRDAVLEIDGERWTPRKVMRRLLWLEWTLGRIVMAALPAPLEQR